MADSLETLFKNLGPNTAAMWAGEREALNNYASEASTAHQQQQIQDLLQKHAQNELMNPLEVQNKQLTNRGLEAELPGKTADSRRKGMEADTYGATQASSIAKTNSTNEYDVLNNKVKQTDALVDILGKGAQALTKLPPAARHAAAYKQIFDMGGQPALDEWQGKLENISGDKLPGAIDAMAQHQAMSSQGMRQELEKLRVQTASHEKIAAGNNATQLQVAQLKKKEQASIESQILKQLTTGTDASKLATAEAVVATKVNPQTGEEYSPYVLAHAKHVAESLKGTMNAANAVKSQGLTPLKDESGAINIENKAAQVPSVGSKSGSKELTIAEKRAALAGK
jgi:hypothetical protein